MIQRMKPCLPVLRTTRGTGEFEKLLILRETIHAIYKRIHRLHARYRCSHDDWTRERSLSERVFIYWCPRWGFEMTHGRGFRVAKGISERAVGVVRILPAALAGGSASRSMARVGRFFCAARPRKAFVWRLGEVKGLLVEEGRPGRLVVPPRRPVMTVDLLDRTNAF